MVLGTSARCTIQVMLLRKKIFHYGDFILQQLLDLPRPASEQWTSLSSWIALARWAKRILKRPRNSSYPLVHKLQISSHGTRIGIIPYHSEAQVAVKFADVAHQTPDAMTKLIKGIPYTSGMTRTDVAIELANNQLFTDAGGQRSDKPNVLIVMTDGHTNPESKPYKTVLAPLEVGRFLSHSISTTVIFGSSSVVFRDLRQCSRKSLENQFQAFGSH